MSDVQHERLNFEAECPRCGWGISGWRLARDSEERLTEEERLRDELADCREAHAERNRALLPDSVHPAVLKRHYLAQIVCDHERKMDNPVCACSLVNLGWHPSVGEAVDAWIEHVIEQTELERGASVSPSPSSPQESDTQCDKDAVATAPSPSSPAPSAEERDAEWIRRSDALADLRAVQERQAHWFGRALKAEHRVSELEKAAREIERARKSFMSSLPYQPPEALWDVFREKLAGPLDDLRALLSDTEGGE